jgi:hypothetical protein
MHRKIQFSIADGQLRPKTHRITDLCDYLTTKVLEPMFRSEGAAWNPRFMRFFSFDNCCDPLEPTGTIKFSVPPMFAGRVVEMEHSIRSELSKLQIRTGKFVYDRDPVSQTVRGITIPVTDNPTALQAPPEVNMSQMRGCLVLRDLLGYQKINGRYEFAPDDLLERVSNVTDEKIAACTSSPVKSQQGVQRTPSAISAKAIRRCLEEVRLLGVWALEHKHARLAAK